MRQLEKCCFAVALEHLKQDRAAEAVDDSVSIGTCMAKSIPPCNKIGLSTPFRRRCRYDAYSQTRKRPSDRALAPGSM